MRLVYGDVNNGVYRCGFAGSSGPTRRPSAAVRPPRLAVRAPRRQRYLVGDTITEADVRLFTTLARFDAVYHGHFKCNRHKLTELPVLWAYARDLFQTPGFGDTIDFEHIKRHYYLVHTQQGWPGWARPGHHRRRTCRTASPTCAAPPRTGARSSRERARSVDVPGPSPAAAEWTGA